MRPLAGQTLGLLGAGDIARQVATTARAFGLRTVACSSAAPSEAAVPFDARLALADVLREADFIVCALPSTRATRGLLDGDALQACERAHTPRRQTTTDDRRRVSATIFLFRAGEKGGARR